MDLFGTIKTPLVAKMSSHAKSMQRERCALKTIHKFIDENPQYSDVKAAIPHVIDHSVLDLADKQLHSIVMPCYGPDLDYLLDQRNYKISNRSIYHLGLQLLDIYEVVHKSGLVFNDLKPDNILIGHGQKLKVQPEIGSGSTTDSMNGEKSGVSEDSTTEALDEDENIFEKLSLHLVDYGFASSWKNSQTGEHNPKR